MWLIDKLFNRKIEGESSLDHLESLKPLEEEVENLKSISDKVSVVSNKVTVDGDFEADGITSKGIANTGALGNIGNVTITGDLDVSGDIGATKITDFLTNINELADISLAECIKTKNLCFIHISGSFTGSFTSGSILARVIPSLKPNHFHSCVGGRVGSSYSAPLTVSVAGDLSVYSTAADGSALDLTFWYFLD